MWGLEDNQDVGSEDVYKRQIQTMFDEEIGSAPGSVSQVRESTNVLMQIAKGLGITIFIVGHVTKEGNVACLLYTSRCV